MKKVSAIFAILLAIVAIVSFARFSEARSPIRIETFHLYAPNTRPSGCTPSATLRIDYFGHTATLENAIEGLCARYIEPDTKVYQMETEPTILGDGIVSWNSTFFDESGEKYTLVIDDYRRTSNASEANIVAREYGPNAYRRTLHSLDSAR